MKDKRIARIHRIANAPGVYDKVIWNKDKTAFIGYSFFHHAYMRTRDYVYAKGNGIIIVQSIVEE